MLCKKKKKKPAIDVSNLIEKKSHFAKGSGLDSSTLLHKLWTLTFNPFTSMKANKTDDNSIESINDLGSQKFYHGTKADLKEGDWIEPGFNSNYGKGNKASYVYLTATLDAAVWGAELALGEGPGRIYIVEPTGPIEDDPNLTDKKYPGNPTKSYRTRSRLQLIGEVTAWQGHPPEQLQAMKEHLEQLKQLGIEAIED